MIDELDSQSYKVGGNISRMIDNTGNNIFLVMLIYLQYIQNIVCLC